jgi:hypothetical protein
MNTTNKDHMVHAASMQTFAHIVFEVFANTAGEHRFLDTFCSTVSKCPCALVT